MYKSILISAAAMASTAYAVGSAVVINGCNYDVHLSSVPAQFGGYETTNHVLSPKETYSQQWTQLSNGAGWSIKLAKETGASSIMQYEYTYQGDNTIWYDLSCVDGNPWDKNWEITASVDKACSPRQAAYRYATDDAYGMQSCNIDAVLTVTLCSGESQNDQLVSSIAAGATVVNTSPAAPKTTSTTTQQAAAPTTTSSTSTSTTHEAAAPTTTQHDYHGHSINFNNNAQQATTLTTAVATAKSYAIGRPKDAHDNIVYVYETVVETATAYETYVPGKRHVHHPDHPNHY